ncbi:hypothetical protein ACFPIH_54475, partial [Streptomyces vulcanius]
MAIEANPRLNNVMLVLTGSEFLQANEDQARKAAKLIHVHSKDWLAYAEVLEQTVLGASRGLPPKVGDAYSRAMNLFVDDGGRNYLKEFAAQLKGIAEGRDKTALNIIESKWQLIAELVQLLIELFVLAVMSVFSGGATAGDMAVARAKARLRILLILDLLMRRTHLMPSLSEAFEEAFASFAVRLALIVGGPHGLKPKGFDWKQIAQDGVFGAFAGLFAHLLPGLANKLKDLVKKFDRHSPFDSKNLTTDVGSKVGKPGAQGGGRNVLPDTYKGTGGLPGSHTTPKSTVNTVAQTGVNAAEAFTVEGLAEGLAESLGGGLFNGQWAWSWDTLAGAGMSGATMQGLALGAGGLGALIGQKFNLNNISAALSAGVNPKTGTGPSVTGGPRLTSGTGGTPTAAGGKGVPTAGQSDVTPVEAQEDVPTPDIGTGKPVVTTVSSDTHVPTVGGATGPADAHTGAGGRPATSNRPVTTSAGPADEESHTAPRPDTVEQSGSDGEPALGVPVGSGHTSDTHVTSPADRAQPPVTTSGPTADPLDTTAPAATTTPVSAVTTTAGPASAAGAPGSADTAPTAAPEASVFPQPSGSTGGIQPQTPTTSPGTPASATPAAATLTGSGPATTEATGGRPHTPAVTAQSNGTAADQTAEGPSTAPPAARQAEHEAWQRLFDAHPDEHRTLLDELTAHRDGIAPTQEEIDLRQAVSAQLAALPGVTVTLDDGADFGHYAAAATLMDSLSGLGYPGPFTVVAPQTAWDRLTPLLPQHLEQRVDRRSRTSSMDATGADAPAHGSTELPGDLLVPVQDADRHAVPGWAELHDADDALSALAALPPTDSGGLLLGPGPMRRLSAVVGQSRLTAILGLASTLQQMADHHLDDPSHSGDRHLNATAVTISPDQLTRLREAVTAQRAQRITAVRQAAEHAPAPTPEQVAFLAGTVRRSLPPGTRLRTSFGTPAAQRDLPFSAPTVSERDTGSVTRPATSSPLTTSVDLETDSDSDAVSLVDSTDGTRINTRDTEYSDARDGLPPVPSGSVGGGRRVGPPVLPPSGGLPPVPSGSVGGGRRVGPPVLPPSGGLPPVPSGSVGGGRRVG